MCLNSIVAGFTLMLVVLAAPVPAAQPAATTNPTAPAPVGKNHLSDVMSGTGWADTDRLAGFDALKTARKGIVSDEAAEEDGQKVTPPQVRLFLYGDASFKAMWLSCRTRSGDTGKGAKECRTACRARLKGMQELLKRLGAPTALLKRCRQLQSSRESGLTLFRAIDGFDDEVRKDFATRHAADFAYLSLGYQVASAYDACTDEPPRAEYCAEVAERLESLQRSLIGILAVPEALISSVETLAGIVKSAPAADTGGNVVDAMNREVTRIRALILE